MIDYQKNKMTKRSNQKKLLIGCMDVLSIALSFFVALWIRFDFHFNEIPLQYKLVYLNTIVIWCAICVVAFTVAKLYNSIWVFVSTDELFRVTVTYVILAAIGLGLAYAFDLSMPRSYYVLGLIFSYLSTVAIRFSYRFLRQLAIFFMHKSNGLRNNVMLIGAGEAGRMLVSEFQMSNSIR